MEIRQPDQGGNVRPGRATAGARRPRATGAVPGPGERPGSRIRRPAGVAGLTPTPGDSDRRDRDDPDPVLHDGIAGAADQSRTDEPADPERGVRSAGAGVPARTIRESSSIHEPGRALVNPAAAPS